MGTKEENKENLRAFEITTETNFHEETYIVIAKNYADAERTYWEVLNGWNEIKSIRVIPARKVGFMNINKLNNNQ